MREFNCPNCGAGLAARLASSKLIVCDYCESTSLLADDAVRLAGEKGVMHARPCLIRLGEKLHYRGRDFMPIGQARFEHGQGWWDEFWALADGGDGVWISVDEGDIAIERAIERAIEIDPRTLAAPDRLRVGDEVPIGGSVFVVTEHAKALCVAVRGELPEALAAGDRFGYVHLRQGATILLTLEYADDEVTASLGEWLDPYEIAA